MTVIETTTTLGSDTHLHVHKENNVLFPIVLQLEHQRAHG
jgi:hypothetical protein